MSGIGLVGCHLIAQSLFVGVASKRHIGCTGQTPVRTWTLECPEAGGLALQDYREQRAEELMGVLNSLWEALEVEQEDVDRGIFVRLMSGPARLHGKSIQKVATTVCMLCTMLNKFASGLLNCGPTHMQHAQPGCSALAFLTCLPSGL